MGGREVIGYYDRQGRVIKVNSHFRVDLLMLSRILGG